MNKQEAERKVKFLKPELAFCPEIKGICNPECICFIEAKISKAYTDLGKEQQYMAMANSCTHVNISQNIYIES